ncbi:BLOC-1-related complex subunit 7 [Manacus vitellinus]|uniref:BLOC-1-related complex subunit 7 n=1 Tax=Manacus vitellinus TaxID=328815 RepID=UPI00115F6318|nr:BLOC-1-related complex subunit 7 [Manacus vitellinus]
MAGRRGFAGSRGGPGSDREGDKRCGTDVIALTSSAEGSRSARLLGQAARNMVMQEDAILHSEDVSCVLLLEQHLHCDFVSIHSLFCSPQSLRKMAIITTHLQYQQEAIQKNVERSSNLQDQLNHLLK